VRGVAVRMDFVMVKFPGDPVGFEWAGFTAQKSLTIWNHARPARSGWEVTSWSPKRVA
jgi:hypothetical protein